MRIVVARDLYEQSLEGDEPEPLEVVTWKLSELDALLERDDFIEARCIAALFLAKKWLKEQ